MKSWIWYFGMDNIPQLFKLFTQFSHKLTSGLYVHSDLYFPRYVDEICVNIYLVQFQFDNSEHIVVCLNFCEQMKYISSNEYTDHFRASISEMGSLLLGPPPPPVLILFSITNQPKTPLLFLLDLAFFGITNSNILHLKLHKRQPECKAHLQ